MDLKDLQKIVADFIDERYWRKFQNTKELALSTLIECSELLSLFQWKTGEEIDLTIRKDREMMYHVKSEISDILFGVLALSDHLNLNLESIFTAKMKELNSRYSKENVKGKVVKFPESKIDFKE